MGGNNIDNAAYTLYPKSQCKLNFTLFVLIILHYNFLRYSPINQFLTKKSADWRFFQYDL
ncbi:MAG: hypothetical protein AXW17_10720 [Colwellia sp. Phe_37]|jgi:hypothetical protein|nr:MAG: hypothetical protein AXW17_10720 [Colwellia sp. Phe_37]